MLFSKKAFLAAALELGFVARVDVGKYRVPNPEFTSTHVRMGMKYILFPYV